MTDSLKDRNTIVMFPKHKLTKGALALLATLALASIARAQSFSYTNNDLALGFRKTGNNKESYEAVVNIGSATNYVNLQTGTTIDVPGFNPIQLAPDSFSDLSFLSWSVSGFAKTNTLFVLPGYNNNTLWLTVPRPSPGTQSAPPARLTFTQQGSTTTSIKSILSGAAYFSSQNSAGPDNTDKFVREPVDTTPNLSTYVAAVANSSGSTLRDTWPNNIETTTTGSFAGTSVADFYEVRPTVDGQGNPVTDPHTGQTSGDAYYVGSFTFKSNGTMTFTRGSSGVVTNPPPTAPTLSVSRTENVTHITFTSDKGAIYTLYYTDASGLDKPISSWTALATKITGDGSTKQFDDTTTDQIRFYRVAAK